MPFFHLIVGILIIHFLSTENKYIFSPFHICQTIHHALLHFISVSIGFSSSGTWQLIQRLNIVHPIFGKYRILFHHFLLVDDLGEVIKFQIKSLSYQLI